MEYTSFTLPGAARVAPADPGRTARLTGPGALVPPAPVPLSPAADPDYGRPVEPAQLYYAALVQRPTGGPGEFTGGTCPPGWAWARLEEYPAQAGHIRVAALKIAVAHDLLAAWPAGAWLAVRWAGYGGPTFFVNAAWVAARVVDLARRAGTRAEKGAEE